jgi:CubicO group peptidase (beta-lactamase class C family)
MMTQSSTFNTRPARRGAMRVLALAALAIGMAGMAASPPRLEAARAGEHGPLVAPPVAEPSPAPGKDDSNTAPHPPHELEARDLEAWLDGMLPVGLAQGKVAGAVVSVVKDGHVLLAKGYGYADMAHKVPMDAQRTLIRPGSVSKLITWTAVMQQVQLGKLDLNADVNRYLDFKIPEPFGKPITLAILMTHRAGFEEGLKDAIVTDPKALETLNVFLEQHIRPVLFAPGEVPAYSNYGTALAGYIVQRVSGERYEDYVAQHIFMPLHMGSSTFSQPLPAALAPRMSLGYMSGAAPARPFELISFAPAGGMTSTASDMANFMIAHLQTGRFGDTAILTPDTTRLMHSASLPHGPDEDVMAHGFFLTRRHGHTLLEHGGDTILFHSDLMLLPQEQVGLFVSFNSRGEGDAAYGLRTRLIDGFMERYFTDAAVTTPPALPSANAHGQEIVGRYETSRRVQSGFMSLFYVLQGQMTVKLNPDATVTFSSDEDKSFREVAPYQWQEVGGTRIWSRRQIAGVKTLVDSHDPIQYFQAVPLQRNATLNLAIFAGSLLILIGAALAWPIAEASRRFYRQPNMLARRAMIGRRLARIGVLSDLAYLGAWFIVLSPILGSDVAFYTNARDPLIRSMQLAGLVPLLALAAGLWNCATALRSRRHWALKTGAVLVTTALGGAVWIACVGGLMSFTLNY